MKIHIATYWISISILISLLGLQGCAPQDPPLRVALLPVLDSLPFLVAEAEGYFQDEGIAVELIAASSAAERDQLFQANQADILITDLVALTLANREQIELVAVRYAMVPTEDVAQFRVLAAPGLDLEPFTRKALTGEVLTDEALIDEARTAVDGPHDAPLSIGISEGTIIHYVTDRLLAAAGFPPDHFETVAVARIAERMALLTAGELSAATLPEPLSALALQQGAKVIVDDTQHPQYSCSIIAVRAEHIETQSEEIQGMLHAIRRANAAINADRRAARWAELLDERQLVPPAMTSTYILPHYPADAVPTEEQVADVAAWLNDQGLLTQAPAYSQIITTAFLK